MLVSLNWIRDFVTLPDDLDPRELAERITLTTAEVEGVEQVSADCDGLVAARIASVKPLPGTPNLRHVRLETGRQTVDVVTAAPALGVGAVVVFAPIGARVAGVGVVSAVDVADVTSAGLIVPAEAIGIAANAGHAVFLPPSTEPGTAVCDAALLSDWVIEIDNKSITHRPDLWGHYGMARELAAIFVAKLKPLELAPLESLQRKDLPEIPIVIDSPDACPRYTGLRFTGVRAQPSPLWMQLRLARAGMRPIDFMVDLTNYVMLEIGQPMHAFDGDGVERIEVGLTQAGDKFVTLDGVERTLPDGALMIMSGRKPVALAGIMGGLDTEITPSTKNVLLESANFDAATIRRAATAMGHRTDASARFEKSLDPENTVIGIRRLLHLARPEWPELTLSSRLSDAFPKPIPPIDVKLNHAFLNRFIGKDIPADRITQILSAIGFEVARQNGDFHVRVPSWRATKDVGIEADLIEEVARFVGYGNIEPALPEVAVRHFEPYAIRLLERRTLELLCSSQGFIEHHGYIWFDDDWLAALGFDPGPCVELRNPAAAGQHRLQTTLVPNLLSKVEKNRHHFEAFRVADIGTTFEPADSGDRQFRHLALLLAARGQNAEDALLAECRTVLETWSLQLLGRALTFAAAAGGRRPWEHEQKRIGIFVADRPLGSMTAVPIECRRRIDEHLSRWSVVVAEVRLDTVTDLERPVTPLPRVAAFPRMELDFSVLAAQTRRFADLQRELTTFEHPLLERLWFVDSYEGKSLPAGTRSLTFRARIGRDDATLTDADSKSFQDAFVAFLRTRELEIRG